MTFGALVNIALGILSIMILFSLAATALQEAIAQALNSRGKRLRDGIIVLLENNFPNELDSKGAFEFFYKDFYDAAGLKSLTTAQPTSRILAYWDRFKTLLRGGKKKLPSAIEPRRYAEAMLRLVGDKSARNALANQAKAVVESGESAIVNQIEKVSEALRTESLSDTVESVDKISGDLQATIDQAQSVVESRLQELEEEFNQTMDRVSGWYGRQTKMMLFLIGLFLAVGANIDPIRYAERLLTDESLRNKAEIYAEFVGKSGVAGDASEREPGVAPVDLQDLVVELEKLDVRVGWCEPILDPSNTTEANQSTDLAGQESPPGVCPRGEQFRWPPYVSQVVGWFLIAFGVTFGAQFWFNLFSTFLNLRTSGKVRGTVAATKKAQQ